MGNDLTRAASGVTRTTVAVIMPSYREADSLRELLPRIVQSLPPERYDLKILLVNDFGARDPALDDVARAHDAIVVDAPYNMGSQEAIVLGVRHQALHYRSEYVVTMDSDGQDDALAIPLLLSHAVNGSIAVARRTGRRPEGRVFRCSYEIYKWAFKILTRITPDFGNFAAFQQDVADHISRSPLFHVTYSLALPKAGPVIRVPVPRLRRLHGRSRIGVQGLFDHAVRSALPYLNVIALRMAMFSLLPATAGMLLMIVSSFLRLFMPRYAFPNWATTIAFGAAMLALQLFTVCLILFLVASLSRQIAAARPIRDG